MEHIEAILQPLAMSISSVETLPCINLQASEDFDGGISLFQIDLAQLLIGKSFLLKS
jgi:hypothetical protein